LSIAGQQVVVTQAAPGGGAAGTGDGLRGEYFDNMNFTTPIGSRVDATVDFDWGSGAPLAGMGTDTFSVRWTGKVQAQFTETYTFSTLSDDGVRLWVNGQLLVDNWSDHAPTENSGSIALAAGQSYDIKLEYYENAIGAVARLLWSSPSTPKALVPRTQLYSAATSTGGTNVGSGDGLRGEYFDNWDFTAPASTRVDPTVDFDWGAGAPQAGMGADSFSVRWTGKVQAQFSELYTFYTLSDDGVRLWVNGQLLIDNWVGHAPTEDSGSIALAAGQTYTITLEYFENINGAVARLLWSSPSTAKAVIPRAQLYSGGGTSGGAVPGTGTGLRGDYFDNWDFTAPVSTRVDPAVDFDWGAGAPQAGMGADTFSVRWTGKVQPQFSEQYTFYTVSSDGVRLWVNGQLLIDNWTNHDPTENSGSITLVAGQQYDITLEFFENTGVAVSRLLWSSPSTAKAVIPRTQLYAAAGSIGGGGGGTGTPSGDGLRGEYYDNWDFTAPVVARVDPAIDFDWGSGAPQAGMGVNTFSVRWTGRIMAPTTEVYTFYTVANDGIRLWINGQLVIDDWTTHRTVTESRGTIALVAGQAYSIKVEYFENRHAAVARLLWSSPSIARQVVPKPYLSSTP
jgi:phage-related protein